MSRILIIEDEAAIRRVLFKILSEENASYELFEASDGVSGLNMIKNNNFDLVLCDIKMPKMDGVEVLENIKKIKEHIPIVMISGHGDLETAVSTMRLGAYDYISKPPDLNRLLNTVRNALDRQKLIFENKKLKQIISKKYEMVGDSESMLHIKSIIDKVAPTNARILVTGPNGTGKELVAHWIHQKSNRDKGPMVEVNCAAIPSELIESELFGHTKGAFTNAIKDREGKFEAANDGTLFFETPVRESTCTDAWVQISNRIPVPAEFGKMVLFPGCLNHGVSQNFTDNDRISISWNIKFKKNK